MSSHQSTENLSSKKDGISATGRVTRVAAKFAYLTSNNYGGVFVPPSAALPPHCSNPDMTVYLKPGDIVHFTATPQPQAKAKNACAWIATHVNVSSQNAVYEAPIEGGESVVSDKTGYICSTADTYAYIHSDEYGRVFFPGSAYQPKPGEPPRLNAVFMHGDLVTFCARSQPEKNGSRWLALSVNKDNDGNIDAAMNGDITQPVVGSGVVSMVNTLFLLAKTDHWGLVLCPILRWSGPDLGEQTHSLQDIFSEGDVVHFTAVPQRPNWGSSWRAISFYGKEGPESQPNTPVAPQRYTDTVETQTGLTGLSPEEFVVRAIKNNKEVKKFMMEKLSYAHAILSILC